MKRYYKWVAFALCFAAFILLGTEIVPLTDRAIVLGIGIDKNENGYVISAQIVLPGDEESKSAENIVLTAEDKTVSAALDAISRDAGKIISMSHCNVVVLGSGVIQHDAVNVLDYIIRNAYLSENAILLATAGKAEEILQAKPAFSDMSSLYLQNVLTNFGYYPVRNKRNVKEFLVSYNTETSGNWLPSVRLKSTMAPESSETGVGQSEEAFVFDFSETAVFSGGNYVLKLDEKGTRGINYVESELKEGSLTVFDGDKAYNFFIVDSSCKKKFNRDMTAEFTVKAELILKEILSPSGVNVQIENAEPGEKINLLIAEEIEEAVLLAYESCKKAGADVFNLYDGFYGIFGAEWKDEYFRNASLSVKTELKFV